MTLEKLLNILLERGWKPRNREKTLHICCYDKCKGMDYQWVHLDGGFMNEDSKKFRELVSKDSGLWQFVCKNGMVGRGDRITKRKKVKDTDSRSGEEVIYYSVIGSYNETDYQYRLIESALKDESELEEFLLNSIIIDD